MNSVMTILVGALLVCNFCLILHLFYGRKETVESKVSSAEAAEDDPKNNISDVSLEEKDSIIIKSKFDVKTFANQIGEKLMSELPRLINAKIGDVTLSEVEFAPEEKDKDESNSESEQDVDLKTNSRLSTQEMIEAFETDLRNIEEWEPSAPVSSGATIDELEEAVSTALDDDASSEDKIKAGTVLQDLQGTELYDRFSDFDEIGERVDFCIRMSIRTQVSAEYRKKKTHQTTQKSEITGEVRKPLKKSKPKSSEINLDNVSLEDFDPENLLIDN